MIYTILLAAGLSSRMGQPKQLLAWQGRPLVRHMAEVALASRAAGLVVVLGAGAEIAREALAGLAGPVQTVECADYASGQAASLRAGLSALPTTATAAVVLLVDMPLVGPGVVDRLIAAFEALPNSAAVVPTYRGRRGNPVLLAARLFPELQALQGDSGARPVLEQNAAAVLSVELDDPAVIRDMDTPEAYDQMHQAIGKTDAGEPGE
jgi:molybdenum cofactor cytidylyltransferase